ncbi:MAG: DUF5058 family protein [Oscillospiraceae bacterium]|nr:DUF5058 family protein [Oscillospiraceae bacterium]
MTEFNVNSPLIYAVAAIVVVFVVSQSVFFLIRAWKQAKMMGMDQTKLRRIATSSAIFTIAPAIAILLGIITLSNALGLPTPWMRLSILGSITYELPAAEMAATATGESLSVRITDPRVYTTILWVMTLGIIPSLFLAPFFMKKIQSGVVKVGAKDKKWGEIFMTALFLGMISAFLGMIFSRTSEGITGWIPVFVMLCSAVLMAVLGIIYKKGKIAWLENYALPLSMLSAMALSIPITRWIGG